MTTTHAPAQTATRSADVPIAVVTGASRGIGAATARRLAADGYEVAVHYGTNEDSAARVIAQIHKDGGRAFAFAADLSEPGIDRSFWKSYDAAAGTRRGAPVYALIHNAGVTIRGLIEDFPGEDFHRQQQINVTAPFLITQAGLPRLAEGGRIVNLSSGVTRIAMADVIGYAMTKGAIDAFTHTLAQHLGPRKITVNAVAPGIIDTDMNASWLRGNEQARGEILPQVALGYIGEPAEVADVVAFLVSADARYITGQTIDVTGGSRL
jgi:NAD(P)-dependent dehydrogenase (short-subunit alcohol dehydrogenase family)